MNIHLFTTESLYSFELLKLFQKTLNLEEHLFIFRKKELTGKFAYSPDIESRIIYSTNFIHLTRFILPKMVIAKWIYFHYLPYGPSLILWALKPSLIIKSTWIVWGGDVFIYKQKNQSVKNRFYEFLRRRIIPRFPEIASFVEEDAREAIRVYNSKAQYVPILYPIPVNLESLNGLRKKEPETTKKILIGNSADPSNNHFEMLEMLSDFKDQSINIYCPLSYGADHDYVDSVVKKGFEIFNSKFIPLLTMIKAPEYAELMNNIDIAIMNHQRQQGLGNIMPLLYLGKKVFLRSESSSFPFFSKAGCTIYDTCSINRSNFAEFISFTDNAGEINKIVVEKMINSSFYSALWHNLFSKHK